MAAMWKRLNHFGRSREHSIGNPTLIKAALDEDTLASIPGIKSSSTTSITSIISGGKKNNYSEGLQPLPPLPFSMAPPDNDQRPDSFAPTVSSIYSQPSPGLKQEDEFRSLSTHVPSSIYTDISPPDSPPLPDDFQDYTGGDVSPIDHTPQPLSLEKVHESRYRSHIPVIRRSPRGSETLREAAIHVSLNHDDDSSTSKPTTQKLTFTRWDAYSGEPTTSETGKPAQVKPGDVSFDSSTYKAGSAGHFDDARSKNPSHGSSVAKRKAKPNRSSPGEQIATKEPWALQSGRSAIVDPVPENPYSKPFIIPSRYESKKTLEPMSLDSRIAVRTSIDVRNDPRTSHLYNSSLNIIPDCFERSTAPTAINGARNPNSSALAYPSPAASRAGSSPAASIVSDRFKDKPLPPPKEEEKNNGKGKPDNFFEATTDILLDGFEKLSMSEQAVSRFSSTTYATTTYESPPTTPKASSTPPPSSSSPKTPILQRKRPIRSANANVNTSNTVPSRKPITSDVSETSTIATSILYSPPKPTIQDRIVKMENELNSLSKRRQNLNTVIHELTVVVQPSSLAYDLAAREEVKKTVTSLERELAEVQREEHDIGLKLHRAYKRRDQDDIYEPTTLWVRRVAS
ncbi:MAG: hypothetical protein M1834_002283 [Cirrosporium novae-zelandiae]|nr:MAG: hypothetical protein M1834_002283 [Cirrosporium novae-zelandiae]